MTVPKRVTPALFIATGIVFALSGEISAAAAFVFLGIANHLIHT